jgi:hypothetical protein
MELILGLKGEKPTTPLLGRSQAELESFDGVKGVVGKPAQPTLAPSVDKLNSQSYPILRLHPVNRFKI